MKTYRTYYHTTEDCNCGNSHDTSVKSTDYDNLKDAIAHCQSFDGEPHEHSVIQEMEVLTIEDDEIVDTLTVIKCYWDYEKKEWGEIVRLKS